MQESVRRRPRARTIAVAAFLATAAAGATVAGLTAANADEAPASASEFVLTWAPESPDDTDKSVAGTGYGVDGRMATNQAMTGVDRACQNAGFLIAVDKMVGAPMEMPDGRMAASIFATCA